MASVYGSSRTPLLSASALFKEQQGRGTLAILFAALVWGGQLPLSKWAFAYMDSFSVTAVRYLVPTLCLLAALVLREGWKSVSFRAPNSAPGRTFLIGLSGMCASPTLVFTGLMFTRPEVAAIIIATQPTLAALALWALRGKRPSGFTLVCVAVAFTGVVMVVTRLDPTALPHGRELAGDVMVLCGALAWVVYTISCERFSHWSSLRVTAMTMLPGAIGNAVMMGLAIWLGIARWPQTSDLITIAPSLAFLSFVGVLAAMMAWSFGQKRIGTLNSVLFVNLIPVVAFTVGFLSGKRFSPVELLGASLVICALIANNVYQRRSFK
jgi:drug/metabolite transporter (DMT)-like permease